MLKLEEYIAKRKKEDLLNEFNKDKKDENLKICVNLLTKVNSFSKKFKKIFVHD